MAGSTITLADVLFGDVWVCSGQSNMALGACVLLRGCSAKRAIGIVVGAAQRSINVLGSAGPGLDGCIICIYITTQLVLNVCIYTLQRYND